jgi:hypothetical protein
MGEETVSKGHVIITWHGAQAVLSDWRY